MLMRCTVIWTRDIEASHRSHQRFNYFIRKNPAASTSVCQGQPTILINSGKNSVNDLQA